MNCLELQEVTYRYASETESVLKNISVAFERAKVYALIGQSGAGKSTLLSLLSGLDTCMGGDIYYNGQNLLQIDRDIYRSQNVGVIFQSFNLLLNATAVYNIVLSMSISGNKRKRSEKKKDAYKRLGEVGIDRETADRTILKLSGGEQQRVGIARALSHDPDIVIADEPTGNLDVDTELAVLDIFLRLAHEEGKCVILVTHSDNVAAHADEVIYIQAGQLLSSKEYDAQNREGSMYEEVSMYDGK